MKERWNSEKTVAGSPFTSGLRVFSSPCAAITIASYAIRASFAVIYVNGARRDVDAPYDRLHDPTGRLASRYNVKTVPRLFVVRDGVVSWALDEYYEGYEKDLGQKIEEATTGEPDDPQTALRED